MRLILMGVSGSGKTTLGEALAARTGWPFLDGDDFHTPEAKAKMAAGLGLSDEDRQPWLERLRAELLARPEVILACSSLRHSYRDVLRVPDARFVFLNVAQSLLLERLQERGGHYAHADLLPSQLQTLEPPDRGEADVLTLHVTAQDSSADLTRLTLSALGLADAR
ncbi:gluconokinase [Deinococcus sp. AJ005]|uniref:gluconokinase n=1 Tax=Deinococcus sp. AJ005 TaxID=2652443 RepID=UPI001CF63BF6|nr:gluconokinase, GntK/IdnK-type [Deinococcus sp. AJ005]